ncbi:MAG: response regulator [Deltaproteobacteria bacterium]|nr:response regulator [Deltaproteobacteria bacterium]MCL5277575.1 response regulator [Deltaproteobacteria bacterium]
MKKVMIVDDEIGFAGDIARLLQAGNDQLSVSAVGSGGEAIQQMTALPADVIVTDIKLPDMSGLDLAGLVKERWPATAIIVMTAYGAEDVIKSAFAAGAMFYIEKPFNAENLGSMIKMAGLKKQSRTSVGKDNVVDLQAHKQPETF